MSESNHGQPPFDDSDQAWFDALSGKSLPADPSKPALEGMALRTALDQRARKIELSPQVQAQTSTAATDAALQRLLEQADREGLFSPIAEPPPPVPSNVLEFPARRHRRTWLALAATVVIGTTVAILWPARPYYPAPPTMLGAGRLQQVARPDTRAAAEAFASRLREAGLRPGLYQRDSSYFVDVTLLPSELPLANPLYVNIGLRAEAGFNRVEFQPK